MLGDHERHTTHNLKIIACEADQFLWIVGHEAYFMQSEVSQNLRPNDVLAQDRMESQGFICFYSVFALILQFVGNEFIF